MWFLQSGFLISCLHFVLLDIFFVLMYWHAHKLTFNFRSMNVLILRHSLSRRVLLSSMFILYPKGFWGDFPIRKFQVIRHNISNSNNDNNNEDDNGVGNDNDSSSSNVVMLKNVVLFLGPTTVNVRITGLTEGLHGFHLVSNFTKAAIIHGFCCNQLVEFLKCRFS